MSYSSLYGIKADYTGEILCEYENSWWFSPVVWSVLSDKTLPKVMGYIQGVIGIHGADDISALDEKEYPYFVFKNTSVDDNVESWFSVYDEETDDYVDKSIKDWDKFLAEFVIIENGEIVKFISNREFEY